MNKRIRLLAEQSGMNAIEPVMDFDRKETHWNGWASAMEKFAELIVQECITQCEKNKDHEWLGSGSKLSAFNIKEHFGVE